ncbi:LysR family transcriptional regulator [Martelella alba]|nr:LysR family transcriptional regulator [Martelella alba]
MILLSKTLRYFIVTAQEQSIRMAALILCITPSPLCRTIKLFELNLGHKLFTRTSTGLKLTNYGRDLYATLLPLYQEICEIEKKVIKKNHEPRNGNMNIKIGLDHHDYSYMSSIFSSPVFKDSRNNVSLEYYSPNETNIDDILERDLCQMFITQKSVKCSSEVLHQTLSADTIMLAVKSDLRTSLLKQTDLIKNNILLQDAPYQNDSTYEKIEEYLAKNRLTPKRVFIPELYVQLSMIEKGDAISFMSSSVSNIINERNFKVKLIPFEYNGAKLFTERHVYYTRLYQDFIEEKLLPLIVNQDKCLAC